MEYYITQTPLLRNSKQVYQYGTEGEWTPFVQFYSGGPVTSLATHARQLGRFFKIGSRVYVTGEIALIDRGSGSDPSATLTIGGFPYRLDSFGGSIFPDYAVVYQPMAYWKNMSSSSPVLRLGLNAASLDPETNPNSSYFVVHGMSSASSQSFIFGLVKSHIANNFECRFSLTYFTTPT